MAHYHDTKAHNRQNVITFIDGFDWLRNRAVIGRGFPLGRDILDRKTPVNLLVRFAGNHVVATNLVKFALSRCKDTPVNYLSAELEVV